MRGSQEGGGGMYALTALITASEDCSPFTGLPEGGGPEVRADVNPCACMRSVRVRMLSEGCKGEK